MNRDDHNNVRLYAEFTKDIDRVLVYSVNKVDFLFSPSGKHLTEGPAGQCDIGEIKDSWWYVAALRVTSSFNYREQEWSDTNQSVGTMRTWEDRIGISIVSQNLD